jgi:predicted chitinase
MIEKLLGHKNPWFTGKSGGKIFAKNFQMNYPNVYEFDKYTFVNILNKYMTEYKIIGPYHKAHFLSQCLHESAHLDTTLEFGSGKNYDPGQHPDALKYGNTVIGDGPKYRGRGLIQLTWKKNYRMFSQSSGCDLITDPDLVAAEMEITIKASAWFWRNNGGISSMFNAKGDINILIDNDKNNVKLITKAVNGGNNGLKEREKYFNEIKKIWGLD